MNPVRARVIKASEPRTLLPTGNRVGSTGSDIVPIHSANHMVKPNDENDGEEKTFQSDHPRTSARLMPMTVMSKESRELL
jgi:hypothetical protein